MPIEKQEVEEFFQYAILIITSFSGTFIGSGFLFLGLVSNKFSYIVVGMIAVVMGVISASLLSLKQVKKEKKNG